MRRATARNYESGVMMTERADPFSVQDKVVLVTGAGRGIGRGIVRVFAARGARVAVNALTPTASKGLVDGINREGGEAHLLLGDLTRPEQAERVVEGAVRHFGGIDVLINTLGDSIPGRVVGDSVRPAMAADDWRRIVDINLTHVFYTSQAAGRHMLAQGGGKVINVSGIAALRGGKGVSAYAAAKSALVGLTRALSLEWAPKVQVNAIAPGSFPDNEEVSVEEMARRDEASRERIPLERVGRPMEVGYLALYLASSASDYMTGQTLYLDGGLSAK